MHHRAPERRAEGDHRCNVIGPLMRDGPGDNAAKAMAYDVDLSTSLPPCSVDSLIEAALDQQVGTFGVEANP